jgi:hypothetical protein
VYDQNIKFGRNYLLQVGTNDDKILSVGLPLTIEFDITRNTLTSANVCQLRIFNLNKLNRNRLHFNISNFGGPYRPVVLKAGYGQNMSVIFSGNISQCWSFREGTNFITQIECFDGGFAFVNGVTSRQFGEGTPMRTVISTTMKDLPNVKVGSVGGFTGSLTRPNSYAGNTAQILGELTGNAFFVDNGYAHALKTNEYIKNVGKILRVSPRSGILNTPILEQTIVRFDMIFEPSMDVGSSILLESLTGESFNGLYKVTSVKHRGVISSAVSGTCITTGEFFYDKILVPVG